MLVLFQNPGGWRRYTLIPGHTYTCEPLSLDAVIIWEWLTDAFEEIFTLG